MFPLQEVLKEFDMEDVAYSDIKVHLKQVEHMKSNYV